MQEKNEVLGIPSSDYEYMRVLQYFKDRENKRELYITPYFYQARCVGVEDKAWGVWQPEPEYH